MATRKPRKPRTRDVRIEVPERVAALTPFQTALAAFAKAHGVTFLYAVPKSRSRP